jgi:DHA1 family tetracycline resistance protein-like MFS transporter
VIGGYLGRIGLHTPFYVAAAMSSATLVFAFFCVPESQDAEDRRAFSWRAAMPLSSLPTLLDTPPLVRGIVITSLVEGFAVSVPSDIGALVLFMQYTLKWDSAQVGLWLTLMGGCIAIGQASLTPVVIRIFGERGSWVLGMSCTAVVLAAAAFIHEGWQMYVLIVGFALVSFVTPVALAIVSKEVAANRLGELQGAFMSVGSVVKALAILVGTSAYGYVTAPAAPIEIAGIAFLIGAAIQVPAVVCALITLRRSRATSVSPVIGCRPDPASLA